MKPDLPATGMRQQRDCIACGSQRQTSLHENRMSRIAGLDLSYRVAQCLDCGAAFANDLAASDDYASYYAYCSKYDTLASVTDISEIDRRRTEFAGAFVTRELGAGGRVLDLGCGSGVLLAALARAGWQNVRGLDPAPNAGAAARSLFGIEGVKQGSIADVAQHYALEEFDLICLTAVLEHLADPVGTLRSIVDSMKSSVVLLIEVPALEGFARLPIEAYGELSIEHINFFSAHSLIQTAGRAGLAPVSSLTLSLWPLATDSLFVLFRPGGHSPSASPKGADLMPNYLRESARALMGVIEGAKSAIEEGGAVIWGAGSHSARLLPVLEEMGLGNGLHAIIDSNQNLQGRSFGRFEVMPPSALRRWPSSNVIVSSFRSAAAIARHLKSQYPNPIRELYKI